MDDRTHPVAAAVPASLSATSRPGAHQPATPQAATFAIVFSLSLCHLLNDLMQSMLPAIYPVLKTAHGLDFGQVGMITLAFQCTASLFQPIVGIVTDRKPQPYSLAAGMGSTLVGLLLLSRASDYVTILIAACLVGLGSAVFHPEASRIARLASGGRYGLAQSLFQVGGNAGSAVGPLLAAVIVVPNGQGSVAWFSAAAFLGMAVLIVVGAWYASNRPAPRAAGSAASVRLSVQLGNPMVARALVVLVMLIFSKTFYSASLGSYFTFYLIDRFGVGVETAQIALFIFLVSSPIGVLAGGWLGDRIGRQPIIWGSILGALPFSLALPHVGFAATIVLAFVIGLIMASSFSAILVYAQELLPGRVGLVAGVFFGFSFGLGGIGAAALGELADRTSLETVYAVCAFLPAIGLLTILLPKHPGRI
ncbi:MAG: MFS transporter, partial [Alphaproteobacteria bacterium]|nr:MFS transporter [Alphaproteobacteria bacterium]